MKTADANYVVVVVYSRRWHPRITLLPAYLITRELTQAEDYRPAHETAQLNSYIIGDIMKRCTFPSRIISARAEVLSRVSYFLLGLQFWII